jgi:S1-C subfamily serine protease
MTFLLFFESDVQLPAGSAESDVALLKFEATDVDYLKIGSSTEAVEGETVSEIVSLAKSPWRFTAPLEELFVRTNKRPEAVVSLKGVFENG